MVADVLLAGALFALPALGIWIVTRSDVWARYLKAVAYQVDGTDFDVQGRRLTGVVDGVTVHVAPTDDGPDRYEARFAADELEGVSITVREIGDEGPVEARTGDVDFDRAIQLTGRSHAHFLAALSAGARIQLRLAVQAGWRLETGVWTAHRELRRYPVPELFRAVEEGVALCAALRREGSVEDALLRRALDDPDLDVRRRAVDMLFEGGMEQALVEQLFDGGAVVAMHVVAALPGAEQAQQLRRLVDHADADTAWSAAQRLASEGVDADVRRGWVRGLELQATRSAAIELLAEAGEVSDVAPLRAVADRWLGGPEARRATEAIAAIQARVEGAQAGALALANQGSGEVTVVPPTAPRGARLPVEAARVRARIPGDDR